MSSLESLIVILPELTLAVLGMILLLVGAVCGNRVTRHTGILVVLSFILVGFVMLSHERLHFMLDGGLPIFAFNNMFVDDAFVRFVKVILLIASSASIMLSWSYWENEKQERPEYPVLVLFATLGMMLMISASNFLSLYVGLELQSLSLYVLAAFQRNNEKSSEAGLKYFVLGALSSGLILYGISLIYGYAGTTDFVSLAYSLRDMTPPPLGIIFGMVFICAALAFKVSAVPFHMWTPDVYEGAPTPVTAFFATAPKVAGLILLTRLLMQPFMGLVHQWDQIIVFVSIASMLVGSFGGLAQTNIKRLMAYSSIANVGYALMGLAVDSKSGVQALLIFLVIYFVNALGAFGVILCLRRKGKRLERISDLTGLGKTNPLLALAMALFMFSMAGVPPLAGFFSKYFIFLATVKAGMTPLALVGVLASVVAAYYYLKVIKVMYFDPPVNLIDPLPDFGVKSVVAVAGFATVLFTFWPAPLVEAAMKATTRFLGV